MSSDPMYYPYEVETSDMPKESSIVASIRRALSADGWKVIKMHGGPNMEAGLPDLLCIRDGRYVWLEVKRPGENITKIQSHRIAELGGYGAAVHVVRSADEARELLA